MAWITLADARAEGYASAIYADARVTAAIAEVEAYLEGVLGNWFDPRRLTLSLDGPGKPDLRLGFPIVAITSVSIDGVAVSLADLAVYNRHLSGLLTPDDRQNPMLAWKYDSASGTGTWPRGRRNISVVGDFAYRDYDPVSATGKVPLPIKRACFLLLPRFLEQAGGPYVGEAWRNTGVTKRATRGQSVEYRDPAIGTLTGDPELDRMLARFRRPMQGGVVGRA